jgi:uncharacterized membrane protein
MPKYSRMDTTNRYRLHWHVLFTHFPLSLYGTAFGFQILHLFVYPDCFELASTVTLLGATIMMIPTMITGWLTWKRQYSAAKVKLFRTKITISFAMLAISLVLSMWRVLHFIESLSQPMDIRHWVFFTGIILLMVGAITEGYYGGRLSHK